MSFPAISYKTLCLAWIAGLTSAPASAATVVSNGHVCAPTPAQAVGSSSSLVPPEAATGAGYRVATFRWDPLLQQMWAMIATCGHPERPAISVPMPSLSHPLQILRTESKSAIAHPIQASLPVVHAGDFVRLWSEEDAVRIELSGIAEENATMGRRIRVRVLRSSLADGGTPQTLSGVVRGFRDVEIER